MNLMSYLNLTLSVILMGYAGFLFFKGRHINRGMMAINFIAGLWATVMYGLFVIDYFWLSNLDREMVRTYVIRPLIFVLLTTLLANVIRMGWRNGNLDG